MIVNYTASISGYEAITTGITIGEDFHCPNCKCTEFRVWFTLRKVVDLTCLHCGNFIHVVSVDKGQWYDE